MFRLVYSALFYLALPIILTRLFWKARRSRSYLSNIAQRFGLAPIQTQATSWVHAVSLGEVNTIAPLIKHLQASYPHIPIVITTTTATGAHRAKNLFGDQVIHCYFPYDIPYFVKRFLKRVQPKIAIFVETELWLNHFYYLKQNNIPIVIANARLSIRSFKRYLMMRWWMIPMLQQVDCIAAQTKRDAKRYEILGAPKDKITLVGSIKFDLQAPHDIEQQRVIWQKKWLSQERLVWIAASTHHSEETMVLAAFKKLKQRWPQLLLVLVPRHPERFDEVAHLCQSQNWNIVRRSHNAQASLATDIFLGDSTGELMYFYSAAHLAFIGGSFVPIGGHNPLEPLLLGKLVITGPKIFNFSLIYQRLFNDKLSFMIKNSEELAEEVERLLSQPEWLAQEAERAQQFIARHRGSVEKHLQLIKLLS